MKLTIIIRYGDSGFTADRHFYDTITDPEQANYKVFCALLNLIVQNSNIDTATRVQLTQRYHLKRWRTDIDIVLSS